MSLWSLRYVSSKSFMTHHIPRCIPLLVRVIAVRLDWHFSQPRVLHRLCISIRIHPYGRYVRGVTWGHQFIHSFVVPTILLGTVNSCISMSYIWRWSVYGAGGQTRTGTRFPSPDFKSGMSTNSITPASCVSKEFRRFYDLSKWSI